MKGRDRMMKKARSDKQKKILGILLRAYDEKGPDGVVSSHDMLVEDSALRTAYGTSHRYMSQIMTKMIRKKLVVRVKPGVFKLNAAWKE